MGKTSEQISEAQRAFIAEQKMFFVATAPAGAGGHVNLSPKGHDTLRVLDATHAAYLDLTGSGAETIAHLRENGRITFMFCAFQGPPKILRLYGRGEVLLPSHADYPALLSMFTAVPGARSIIRVTITRVSDSCGYSVPRYAYRGEREQLQKWAAHKGEPGLTDYKRTKNRLSIDGLPALPVDPPEE